MSVQSAVERVQPGSTVHQSEARDHAAAIHHFRNYVAAGLALEAICSLGRLSPVTRQMMRTRAQSWEGHFLPECALEFISIRREPGRAGSLLLIVIMQTRQISLPTTSNDGAVQRAHRT